MKEVEVLEWKLPKLVQLASGSKGIRHSRAMQLLHVSATEMEELVEKAVYEELITIHREKGRTKPVQYYVAEPGAEDALDFLQSMRTDVTEQLYPR